MTKLDLIKKERTVYGYDIVKAVSVAFRMAENHGKPGNAFDITETILRTLMDDDIYKCLHEKAKEENEEAMGMVKTLDKITKLFKEIFDE